MKGSGRERAYRMNIAPLDLDLWVGYLVIVGRVAGKAQVAILIRPAPRR
jgi:hypothetical protein